MDVYFLESTNPWLNLATEEYLLKKKPKIENSVSLLFYENSNSIILGKSLQKEEEIFSNKITPPVLRRMSGGGAVVHLEGNLNYSLIISLSQFKDFYPIRGSYKLILSSICDSFSKWGFLITQKGLSDLAVLQGGSFRKISGNSQARKKNMLLHHGTFLYSSKNKNKISYFLKPPKIQPEYRANRDHKDFLLLCDLPSLSKSRLVHMMIRAFERLFQTKSRVLKLSNTLEEQDRMFIKRLTLQYFVSKNVNGRKF